MEWSEFQKRAVDDVSEGYRSKAPSDQRLVQVLIIPSLEAVSSTELFIKQPGIFFVARKVWNREHDVEKYQTSSAAFRRLRYLAPTIETHITRLNQARAEGLLELFRALWIPVWIPDTRVQEGGTRYQVTLETTVTCVQFQWTTTSIQAWSALNQASERFVEMVKGLIERKH
jgi:hypothetical protein